jgi:carboxynorspermidine decarboxylase
MLQKSLENIPTPAYVADVAALKANLATAARIKQATGCKILLATKAFAMPALFPLMRGVLDGTTASGLFEARLGREEFGKEVHVYVPAYKESEFGALSDLADHIYFNTPAQLARFLPRVKAKGKKAGLRINPGFSNTSIGGDLYNPCAPCSRFGTLPEEFDRVPWEDIDILHAHVLCDCLHDSSAKLIDLIADQFGHIVKRVKAVNFGGGHYFNHPDYDVDVLIDAVRRFRTKFPHVEVIFEPGGALVYEAGYLVATVLDFHRNQKDIAILDTSANCHMPIVLQANYRQPLIGSGEPGEFPHNYVLGGNMCMTGDVIGEYSFPAPLKIGDRLIFRDMLQYSFVQNNTFNGMALPDLFVLHEDGTVQRDSAFGYDNFRVRLGFAASKGQAESV